MANLLYKELKLSIHWFFYVLPFMLACLMFIPQWIYSLVFMYFFWMSISQICAGYIAKEDNSFNAMLPVTKREIAKSKIAAILIVEGIHLVSGIILGLVHNAIYGNWNLFMDINLAFFGVIFLMYAIFNIVFMPMYFKTAYFFGKPVIYGVVVTLIYAFAFEYGAIRFEFMRNIFEGELGTQFIVAGISLVLVGLLSYITIKKSISNYESIA